MKKLLTILSLVAVTATPALAETSKAYIEDHYKTVLEQKPYTVEVCKNVQVPVYGQTGSGASAGDVLGGMIIGGLIGKGVTNKDNGAAAGAVIGGMIAADKNQSKQTITGYRTETQCQMETRYEETERSIYSHSTVRFWHEGQRIELKFHK
jgi:outer membrane lipoprotein SlyB